MGNVLKILTIIVLFIGLKIDFVEAKRQINFNNLTIEDGLSQATVETIFQDSEGYIWFGTNDGLDRYNGYTFKRFFNKRGVEESLVHNYILDIKEDQSNNMWISTTKGISRLGANYKYIENYNVENGKINNGTVEVILISSDKKVYAGTAEGISIYDEKLDKFIPVFTELSGEYITSMVEDEDKNIWVGTYNGLYRINPKSGQINLYDNELCNNILREDKIYSLYYDSYGYIWIGTYTNGAFVLNLESNEMRQIAFNNDNRREAGSLVRSFLRDSKGSLWICTSNGLVRYDESKDTYEIYAHSPYDKASIIDNDIFNIMEDSSGLLWVGTYSGVSIFDPYNKIYHYKNDPFNEYSLNENMIGGIYEDDEGIVWIGTNSQGLNLFYREEDTIISLNYLDKSFRLSNDSVQDITGYGSKVFVATSNGLNILDKEAKTLKIYNMSNGLSGNNIKKIYYDDLGYLWIGSTTGLDILNIDTGEIVDLNDILANAGIENKFISALFKDSKGNYWIGTFLNEGLLKINPNTNELKVYKNKESDAESLSDDTIRCINEDYLGNIWIGTSSGVNKYREDEDNFIIYTTEEGLANNTIYGILFDEDNNPWVSTNLGISKINLKNNVISTLNTTDGLQSNEFNGNSAYKTRDGEFIFGGINGINVFNPKDVKITNKEFGIAFDEFEINGTVAENINNRSLNYNENNIKVTFFLPNYKSMKNIQYYYSLSKDEDEWIPLDNNYVILANLADGKYSLSIRARASDGTISDVKTIDFLISPPIWRSDKAMIIYILLALMLIIKNKLKMNKLDRMVLKRTKQLSDEMEKSTELLNKVIDLERKKNNYFVNLSHELRTPLNVIYSTQQLILELNKEGILKEKLDSYMDIVGRNAKRLLKMINDIIDTSKIENGNYHLNIKENDIVYLVEEGVLTLKEYIEGKGVNLIVDPEIEEKGIKCDYEAIERCIINLVSNAAKFTKKGDTITVNIKEKDNKVIIEVIDTGIGIEKEYHKTIFNRFNQIVDENAEKKGGSGLGLTITKQIIDLHDGDIYVESEVGKGSKFVIVLPS